MIAKLLKQEVLEGALRSAILTSPVSPFPMGLPPKMSVLNTELVLEVENVGID
jgi:hypothetical protein